MHAPHPTAAPIISAVVLQYLEDTMSLRNLRSVLLRSPHIDLLHLIRHDDRLEAHIDGMRVAGDAGYSMALSELEEPTLGALFTVAVLALERGDTAQVHHLLAMAKQVPNGASALASAAGYVSASSLRGWTAPLLQSSDPWHAWLGLAACAAHRVDAGTALTHAVRQPSLLAEPLLRARALRMAGQLGRVDLLPALLAHLDGGNTGDAAQGPADCQAAAARAAVLLGDRAGSLAALRAYGVKPEAPHIEALQLYLMAAPLEAARCAVRDLSAAGAPLRAVIRATAWAGDVQAVPWLIRQMADVPHARVAGEAFSTITGAHLARLDLEDLSPRLDQAQGVTDEADGDNVALDEDEGLPWPDVAKVKTWWQHHPSTKPSGSRVFMGQSVNRTHSLNVLRHGGQRQRCMAALHLALLEPNEPLFNCAAPARRQHRLLAAMA